MKKVFIFLVCTNFCLSILSCSKSKPVFKAGMWEITSVTVIKGAPMKIPPVTYKQCITEENYVPTNQKANKNHGCVVKNQKISGSTASWESECKTNGMTSTGSGEVVYEKESMKGKFEMTSKMAGNEMKVTVQMTGKRIGDCKK